MVVLTGVLALGLMAGQAYAGSQAAAQSRVAAKAAATRTAATRPAAAKKFTARAAMIQAANAYFKNAPVPVISAADLYKVVQAKDAGYQIVDVRSAEHYALGHIDGAINIPFTTIADDASLAKLDPAKTIVTVCYTGETASMTNMVWSMLGYKVTTLMYGMTGWVADKAIVGIDIPSGKAAGYATVTKPTVARKTFHAPKLKGHYVNVAQAVKGQARAYFAKGLAPVISASDLHQILGSRSARHYQVVSVYQHADYAKGHIKGAINIVWTDIADQMRKLDPKKTTVVYCYTGNTGAEDAMLLNLMGYTTYNLMSGMSSWSNDAAVGGFAGYDPATVPNYPTVK